MKRGAKPTSDRQKEISGTFRPDRAHGDGPAVDSDVGPPPEDWPHEAQKLWFELVEAAPLGVVTHADRFMIEVTCRLMAKIRASKGEILASEVAQLRMCLGTLGMTPADRLRFPGSRKEDAPNPFAELSKKHGH